MPAPKALEKSGVLIFLSALFLFAAMVGFVKKAVCGNWPCGYFFLALAVIFFLWGLESVR